MTSIYDRLRTPPNATDVGVRELMAVREIVHAFLTADRPDDVYQFALDRVAPLVGATFACVYLIDDGSDLMRLAAVHNWPEKYAAFLGHMRVRLGFGPSGEAASERRTIEVLDVFGDPSLEDWQEVATELGFRSFVALPLQAGQATLGTVTFYFASPQAVRTGDAPADAPGRGSDGGDGGEGATDRGSAQGERGVDATRTRSSSGSTRTPSRRDGSRMSFSRTFRTSCERRSRP